MFGRQSFVGRRRGRVLAAASIGALGLGMAGVVQASAATNATHLQIVWGKLDTSGNLVVKLQVKCPASTGNYVLVEADQDQYPNDTSGSVFDGNLSCTGHWQTVKETVPFGTPTAHIENNNDQESDDYNVTFTTGTVEILVIYGGNTPYTIQERTLNVDP